MVERAYPVTELGAVFRRRKRLLFLPLLGFVLVGAVLALVLPPVYKSTATLLIEGQEIPTEFVTSTVNLNVVEHVYSISKRVMTVDSLSALAEELNLFPEQRGALSKVELAKLVRENIGLEMLEEEVIDSRTGRVRKAAIGFTLSFTSRDPAMAKRGAQRLAEMYLEENRRSRTAQARDTSEFLAREAAQLSQQISDFEAKLAEFKTKHAGYLPDSQRMNQELYERTQQEYEKQLAVVRALEEKRRYLQLRQSMGVAPDGEDRLTALRAELQEAQAKYSEIHPDVVRLKRAIESEQARLRELAASGGSSRSESTAAPDDPAMLALQSELQTVLADLSAARLRLSKLQADKEKYQKRMNLGPEIEQEYLALSRGYENALRKFEEIKDKQLEARLAEQMEASQKGQRFTLLERPRVPELPYSPNRVGIMLLSVLFGLLAGIGSAGIAEMRDHSVHGSADLSNILHAPPIGAIPYIETPGERRRRRANTGLRVAVLLVGVGVALYAVHVFVMPLGDLWVSMAERFGDSG